MHRNLCLIIILLGFYPVSLLAQRVSTKATKGAVETDSEANKVLSAAQRQVKNLDPQTQQQIVNSLADASENFAIPKDVVKQPSDLLDVEPSKMSLQGKNAVLASIQTGQRVVDPTLVPSSVSSVNLQEIVSAFMHSNPLNADETKRYGDNMAKIPTLAKSVGRLLWADKRTGKWIFEGTVFVTKPNIVATACHSIEPIADISNGTVSLRTDRMAAIDFSDVELPDTGLLPQTLQTYPVVKIMSTGSTKGCDVAFLQIDGASSIPSLKFSDRKIGTARILVIGYPQLIDLTPLTCKFAPDETTIYFCKFHAANPGLAKVKSPGTVYTLNSHNGIGIFTYNASSRGGQSGSPVIDLDTLGVVGVHYCCTGSTQVDTTLDCATWHAQNVSWNEALSSATLITDKALNGFIEVGSQSFDLPQLGASFHITSQPTKRYP